MFLGGIGVSFLPRLNWSRPLPRPLTILTIIRPSAGNGTELVSLILGAFRIFASSLGHYFPRKSELDRTQDTC